MPMTMRSIWRLPTNGPRARFRVRGRLRTTTSQGAYNYKRHPRRHVVRSTCHILSLKLRARAHTATYANGSSTSWPLPGHQARRTARRGLIRRLSTGIRSGTESNKDRQRLFSGFPSSQVCLAYVTALLLGYHWQGNWLWLRTSRLRSFACVSRATIIFPSGDGGPGPCSGTCTPRPGAVGGAGHLERGHRDRRQLATPFSFCSPG